MSETALRDKQVLSRTVLLYESAKSSRKFHAANCNCTGQGNVRKAVETTVRGALAQNYHPAPCVSDAVRRQLGDDDLEDERTD